MIRFVLGVIIMIGALVFLGCPLRMVIRMSAGDLNAYVALIGFAGGVATGTFFLKKGFSLGRAYETKKANGMVLPIALIVLLIIGVATGAYAASTEGPGSMHAPIAISLIIALIIGIIAHSQHLWNILGMYVVGFGAVLAGGCPLRQLILAGQGSSDSTVTFLGMLLGAAFAHNFGLAGAAAKAATETEAAVAGGPATAGKAAVIACIIVLFIIAVTNKRNLKRGK